ncbi:MAG TPA: hypothetical protein VKX17_10715 [Planctomycetota bacterium]|nr:hypothetical protein [Planctomycetota bacterium]
MKFVVKIAAIVAFAAVAVLISVGNHTEATSNKIIKGPKGTCKGLVIDGASVPIAGATVYAIPASLVDVTSPITPATITSGQAEAYDEPLEDIINNPITVKTLAKGVTNTKGQFSIKGIDQTASYFFFAVPAATDTNHLPGGDLSRAAITLRAPKAKRTAGLTIHLTWAASSTATYIGTTQCYTCHSSAGPGPDATGCKSIAHALMFHKPNLAGDTANQDSAGHQGSSWNALASKFTVATQAKPNTKPVPVSGSLEALYVTEYNPTSATNNGQSFVVYENHASTNIDPTLNPPATFKTLAIYYLWCTGNTATDTYYITIENVFNEKDPKNFLTLQVPFFMGGYLRQKPFVKIPGLKGNYGSPVTFLSLPGSASQGLETNYDRSRRPFIDSLFGSFTSFAAIKGVTTNGNTTVTSLSLTYAQTANKLPTSGAPTEVSCAACHVGFGSIAPLPSTDPVTGEQLSQTVNDPNGVFDLAGDGNPSDVGINCEQCHGPGSDHQAAMTASPKGSPKAIVNPKFLGADRASLICGRCHDPRGILANESANFPLPGISRAYYIANYVAPTQKSFAASGLWPDQLHGKGGHHGLTYENYLCSKHSRNSTRMVACDDCHKTMGTGGYRYALAGDPDNSSLGQGLCNSCHNKDISAHVTEKTGSVMKGTGMNCINCHMTRTGKGGAGRPGLLLGTPTGAQADANLEYWQGDQSSHVFDVIHKFDPGVAGTTPPGTAMPSPYTNSCGTCHDASKLPFQSPQ